MATCRFSGNHTAVKKYVTMHSCHKIYLIQIFAKSIFFLEFGVFIILLCYKINKVVTN